jgi:hypothetical protein
MTPSINRLAFSAKALGEYILEAEFSLLEDEFINAGITDLSQFLLWVTGYMYYNALVCVCEGNEQAILDQLTEDWVDLAVVGQG